MAQDGGALLQRVSSTLGASLLAIANGGDKSLSDALSITSLKSHPSFPSQVHNYACQRALKTSHGVLSVVSSMPSLLLLLRPRLKNELDPLPEQGDRAG